MLTPFVNAMRLVLITVIAVLSGCSLLAPKPEVVDTQAEVLGPIDPALQQGFSDALVLLRDEEYVEAEAALVILTTQYPDFAGPWSNLAIAQNKQEKFSAALESIDKALGQDGSFCQAMSLKGVILRELGQFKLAKEQYQAAIVCNPEDALSIYNLGVLSDLYLHDEVSALGYYQAFLKTQGEEQDETIKSWVVDIKRRVPEPTPEIEVNPGADVDQKLSEPQLAGEEI
jgi:tetratricopeptide (TPR) repeat protein